MSVSEQTAAEIRAAMQAHAQAVETARSQLLDAADDAIAQGHLTTAEAAAAVGVTRVTLSRQLNAHRRTGRPGGGRAQPADRDAAAALGKARKSRDDAIAQADETLMATVARAVDERRASISAAAALLGHHRETLARALAAHRRPR